MLNQNMSFALSALRGTKLFTELGSITRSHSLLVSSKADLSGHGSGTLIKYNNVYGILTATHVFADCIDTKVVFSPIEKTYDPTIFLCRPLPIKQIIHLETTKGLELLKGEKEPDGTLDICLLLMEELDFKKALEISSKSYVDLNLYKKRYEQNFEKYCIPDSARNWSYVIEGYPDEGAHSNQNLINFPHDGTYLCGGAMEGATFKTRRLKLIQEPYNNEDADVSYHDFGPTIDKIPQRFGGISGGGMWMVSFSGQNNIPEKIDELFFAGICVSEELKNPIGLKSEVIRLVCKGPDSLYRIFTSFLETL